MFTAASFLSDAASVHTTGINWEAVTAIAAVVTVLVVPSMALISRYFGLRLGDLVEKRVDERVNPLIQQLAAQLSEIRNELNRQLADIRSEIKDVREIVFGHDTRIARLEGREEGKQMFMEQNRRRQEDWLPTSQTVGQPERRG